MNEFREWSMWIAEWLIVLILIAEFFYDKHKDDIKAARKTKTTKKTTMQPSGISVTEESTEVSEPITEEKK